MKMKRFILTSLLFLFVGINSFALDYDVEEDGLYYKIEGYGAKVVGCTDSNRAGILSIPKSVWHKGITYKVYSIGSYAFYKCTSLTSVSIPNSVWSVKAGAFSGCTGLTSVSIPNSVTTIGEEAFYRCEGLRTVYITDLAAWCNISFEGSMSNPLTCDAELRLNGTTIRNLVIPEGITTINDLAFASYSYLWSVSIPNSVTSIGDVAFSGCTDLKSVSIPNSVTSIGRGAFSGCTGLTSVSIPNSVTSIGDGAFEGCTGLTSVSIPNSVTSIGSYAFNECTGLTSMSIPNSVTNIGDYAFSGCTGLTSMSIPNSVTTIGENAFFHCIGLKSVSIPNSVTSIGHYAFGNCTELTEVTIPESVTSIGTYAFSGCTGLTLVTLESNAIVSKTLAATNFLLNNIFGEQVKNYVIGDGVSAIGAYAFNGCSNMQSVTIGRNVTSMSSNAFSGCTGITTVNLKSNSIVSTSRTSATSMKAIFGKQVKKYVIDYGVRAIGDYAFSGYTGLTAFTIPKSVAKIGNYAFQGCTGLTSMSIPNSVTSIGNYAFQGCTGLKSVSIPNSVTNIGDYAFSGCTGLTSMVFPESVTSIGKYAFSGCTGLTSVGIPVSSIGDYAFQGCTGLTYMVFPESVTSIGKSAFKNCINLKSVSLGKNMTTIWTGTFSGCKGLTSVTIESNALMTTVGKGEDYGNTTRSMKDFFGNQVKEYVIGNSVSTIGDFTFSGCTNLTAMIIPYSVKKIGKYAFDGCTSMTSVTIGSSVETMSAQAFRNCPLLSMKIYRKTPPSLTDLSYSVASKEYYFPDIENITLIVPRGCKTTYKNHPFWGGFRAYMEFDADNITETFTLGCIRGYVGRSGSKLVGTSTFDNASELALIEYNDTTYLYDVTNKAFVIHSSDNPETVGQNGNQLQESNVNLSKAVKGLKFGATDIEAFPYYLEDCYGNWLNMNGSKNVCMNKWKDFEDGTGGNTYYINIVNDSYDMTEAIEKLERYYNPSVDPSVDSEDPEGFERYKTFYLNSARGYVGYNNDILVGRYTFDTASELALIEYKDTTYLYDVTNNAFVIHSSDNPEAVGQYGNQLQESNVNLSKAVKGLKFGATDIEAFPYYLEDCYGNWLNMDGSKNVCMNKWKSFDDGNLYQIETVRTDYDPTEAITMLKEYYNDQSDTGVDEIQDSTSVITEEDGAWYTLDGRRIDDARPTRKGIYIRNGRKVLVK